MRVATNFEYALLEARALARAGELTSRSLDEKSDQDAIGAIFRAIDDHLAAVTRTDPGPRTIHVEKPSTVCLEGNANV